MVGKERCEFLPAKGDEGIMLDARDAVLVSLRFDMSLESGGIQWIRQLIPQQASVKDIEDIVVAGKKSCVCPYYSTRRAVKQAQVGEPFVERNIS